MIKEAEPNKYVLDAVNSRDPVRTPRPLWGRVKGHLTYFLNFWDTLHNFWTEEARHFVFIARQFFWGPNFFQEF